MAREKRQIRVPSSGIDHAEAIRQTLLRSGVDGFPEPLRTLLARHLKEAGSVSTGDVLGLSAEFLRQHLGEIPSPTGTPDNGYRRLDLVTKLVGSDSLEPEPDSRVVEMVSRNGWEIFWDGKSLSLKAPTPSEIKVNQIFWTRSAEKKIGSWDEALTTLLINCGSLTTREPFYYRVVCGSNGRIGGAEFWEDDGTFAVDFPDLRTIDRSTHHESLSDAIRAARKVLVPIVTSRSDSK